MKLRHIIIILPATALFLFLTACSEPDAKVNDLENMRLKGDVMKMGVYKLTHERYGDIAYDDVTTLMKSFENMLFSYEFNRGGNITSMIDTKGLSRTDKKYDEKGRLISEQYENMLDESAISWHYKWSGDRLKSKTEFDGRGETVLEFMYDYDKQDRYKLITEYDATGELFRYRKYTWAEDGFDCEEEQYDVIDDTVLQIAAVRYDEEGRERQRITTDSDSYSEFSRDYDANGNVSLLRIILRSARYDVSLEQEVFYDYNDSGDITSEHTMRSTGESSAEVNILRSEYIYDDTGNWILQRCVSEDIAGNEIQRYTVIRDITYFDN